MSNIEILKRLYVNYTKKYLNKIFIALILSIILAGSTSSIAYLLDPAIEKIFIDKDKSLILIIPFLIVIAFASKGISLYGAKVIMINISEEIKKSLQMDMMKSLSSDEDIEEVLKKLKSNIDPNENISEDGNSDTAAGNETEQANDNAKDKDNKESNND